MKLSIVTVCRNEEVRISKTIESVLRQTFSDFEYIIIDGASTDKTISLIQNCIKNAPNERVSHFVSEADYGIYDAQNKGIRLSKGEYLLFINGGDYLVDDGVLQKVFGVNNLVEDIIYGNLQIDNGISGKVIANSPSKLVLSHMLRSTLWHPVSFIKRDLFLKYGFYDVNLKIAADYDFFLKVIFEHNVSVKYLPITICNFNLHGIGSSPKFEELHQKERVICQKRYFSDHVLEMYDELEGLRLQVQNNQMKGLLQSLRTLVNRKINYLKKT